MGGTILVPTSQNLKIKLISGISLLGLTSSQNLSLPLIILVMFCISLGVCVCECLNIHTQPYFVLLGLFILGFILNYLFVLIVNRASIL